MCRLAVQLGGVRIGIAEDVACKLDDHHLHTQADTESGQVVFAAILSGNEFAFGTALSETGANHVAGHAFEHFAHVFARDVLRVDKVAAYFSVIVDTGLLECLDDRLVSVLQIVFTDETDVQLLCGVGATVEERTPRTETGRFAHGQSQFLEDHAVDTLVLHANRYLVNRGHVGALEHCVGANVAEVGHFLTKTGRKRVFGAKNEDVGLDSFALQFLYRVLGGLCFQFARSSQVGNVGQVDANRVAAEFPLELANGFYERETFDVTDCTANLCDHKIISALFAQIEHIALDFIRDVRNHLNRFAQIVATTFLFDHALVDASGRKVVIASGFDAGEAFVVAEIEVGFLTVVRYVAFSVLIGIERAGVDVDVGIKLLNRDVVAASLQQLRDRTCDNAFAQRRCYAAGDEDIFCISHEVK